MRSPHQSRQCPFGLGNSPEQHCRQKVAPFHLCPSGKGTQQLHPRDPLLSALLLHASAPVIDNVFLAEAASDWRGTKTCHAGEYSRLVGYHTRPRAVGKAGRHYHRSRLMYLGPGSRCPHSGLSELDRTLWYTFRLALVRMVRMFGVPSFVATVSQALRVLILGRPL